MKSSSTTKEIKKKQNIPQSTVKNKYTTEEKFEKKHKAKAIITPENKKKIKFSEIEQNLHEIKILYEEDVKNKEKISLIIPILILFYEKQVLFLNIKIIYSRILQELKNHPEQIVTTTYYKCMNQINTKNYQQIIKRLATNSCCFNLKNDVLELKADYIKKNTKNIINRYFSNLLKNKTNINLCEKNDINNFNGSQDEIEISIEDDSMDFEICEENENQKSVDILSASNYSIKNEKNFIEKKFGDKKLNQVENKKLEIKSEPKLKCNNIMKISCQSEFDDTSDETLTLIKEEKNFDKNTFLNKKRSFFALTSKLNNIHQPFSDELLKKIMTKGGKFLNLIEKNENEVKLFNYDERILIVLLNELNYQYSEFKKCCDYSLYFKKIVSTEDFPIVEKVSKINKENINKSELLIKSILIKIKQIFIEFNFIEKDLLKNDEKASNDLGLFEKSNDNNKFDEDNFMEKMKNSLEKELNDMKACTNY